MTKAAPISPLLERAARALNQVDWRYYMHQDDNAARKRRRTASIRNARNVFKALGIPFDAVSVRAGHLLAVGEPTSPAEGGTGFQTVETTNVPLPQV